LKSGTFSYFIYLLSNYKNGSLIPTDPNYDGTHELDRIVSSAPTDFVVTDSNIKENKVKGKSCPICRFSCIENRNITKAIVVHVRTN